ncbi:MAG: hypothetical protein A2Z51_06980 [Deltaproteobacteria bacterium RBG_19FT_COMBO_52_11]|nr:MAG: hypothetical protein A2Z51_06980 [Deltaproteobacteria bacterium RBG_19FT_COMBO_52_11]
MAATPMGARAKRRVKLINLVRIFQYLKGFIEIAFLSIAEIYQTQGKISNLLHLRRKGALPGFPLLSPPLLVDREERPAIFL